MSEPSPGDTPIHFVVNRQGVAILRVNRPQSRNAMNWAAQERFAGIVEALRTDERVRALIITGTGAQAFVSGADLKELQEHPGDAAAERLHRTMSGALAELQRLPLPVIAAINGDAFGGGCEILTACDLRVAVASARFSFAQVRNALTTGWGGTGRLVALLGQSRAADLLLTGRVFDAEEAQRIGFLHRVTSGEGTALDEALAWAQELVALPRDALAAIKALVFAAAILPPEELLRTEGALFVRLWSGPDHLEALEAFNERRPPRFNRPPVEKTGRQPATDKAGAHV